MGLLSALGRLLTGESGSLDLRPRASRAAGTYRHGCFETMEPRRLMAADTALAPYTLLGGVYFEEATGDDSQGDILQVSFVGGAAGTTLDRLTINGDKREDGLTDGDVFFDIAAGGLGAFKHNGLSVISHDGFDITGITVVDGGSQIVFTLSGFDAGEKLVFSVDADEAQFVDGSNVDTNALVEGAEFQRSTLFGEFSAPGYVDLSLKGTYWDDFDPNFQSATSVTGQSLNLPNDAYDPGHDYTDRTAGAIVYGRQIPLATLSGWVYHDRDDDGNRDTPTEEGIGGVKVELLDSFGNPTGITTTTSTAAGKIGYYEFKNLLPGTYGVREFQPTTYLDGKDTAGSHGGTAANESAGIVDRITGAVLVHGSNASDYNFGELLAGSIHGRVHAHTGPDCEFDNPEILLEGVEIQLLDAQGTVIATTFTDENGEYKFTGLRPGQYQVREIQPEGYYDGGQRAGTAGGVQLINDVISQIMLGSGIDAFQYDFCEHVGVNLSGYVYHDRDDDGNFDTPSEEGIGGVVLWLLDGNGVDTGLRATTDSAGFYIFTNLAEGDYQVREIHPAAWLDGKDTPGNHGGVAAASPPGDLLSAIFIPWGQDAVQYNFGELKPASVRGRVHAHTGPDCNFDNPEILLEGVEIQLLDAQGNILKTTLTDENGEYEFTGLRPGEYQIREIQPEDYYDGGQRAGTAGGTQLVNDVISQINLGSEVDAVNYDFCERIGVNLSGYVYHDQDDDGNYDRPGESPIAGVTVKLFDGNGNDTGKFAVTDVNGFYQFTNLEAGTYSVVEVHPNGWLDGKDTPGNLGGSADSSPPGDRISQITIEWGEDGEEYNFGELLPVSIRGRVHAHTGPDCDFDNPEVLLEGVEIQLLDAQGNVLKTTFTDEDGEYAFTGLRPGQYQVREIQPDDYYDGGQRSGTAGGTQLINDVISQINLGSGVNAVNYDFCERIGVNISGYVYHDSNDDGIFDRPGEDPIAGVVVKLFDANGSDTGLRATTNSTGFYQFTNLEAGKYSVMEIQPAGWLDGKDTPGNLGGVADPNSEVDMISQIMIDWGQTGVEYNFGELLPASLSGYVFIDGPAILVLSEVPEDLLAGKDGLRTPDDRPLAGVVLELRHGISGDPIFGDEALSGFYGPGPIRTVTDANGYYEFIGLRAGTYAVVQIQPENLIDSLDTPGTLGGLAVNPSLSGLAPSAVPIPSPDQLLIDQFRTMFGENVILQIALPAGANSEENNFSEIEIRRLPPPPDIPEPLPPPPVFFPLAGPYIPPPLIRQVIFPIQPPGIFGGSSGVIGYTWHLSVVDAGLPRSVNFTGVAFQTVSASIDVTAWQQSMDQALWLLASLDGEQVTIEREGIFGHPNGIPVSGDFNGDGVSEMGVYIDGQWFIDLNGNGRWDEGDLWAQLGSADDLPVTGDWDGDGKTDLGIFGPAWPRDPWAIYREPGLPDAANHPTLPEGMAKNMPPAPEDATSGARVMKRTAQGRTRADLIDHVFHYGTPGDVPIVGDWNGDGIKTIGVFRDGQWILDTNGDGRLSENDAMAYFGTVGDIPVVGDWNRDGIDDLGVFQDGHWNLDENGNREHDAYDRVFDLGQAGDRPVVGDWDGDGADDPGIYRIPAATDQVTQNYD